jgi:hypothetical protein
MQGPASIMNKADKHPDMETKILRGELANILSDERIQHFINY